MDVRKLYDAIVELQDEMHSKLYDAEIPGVLDYKTVKALAGAMEVQDYLARKIAIMISLGELDPEDE